MSGRSISRYWVFSNSVCLDLGDNDVIRAPESLKQNE